MSFRNSRVTITRENVGAVEKKSEPIPHFFYFNPKKRCIFTVNDTVNLQTGKLNIKSKLPKDSAMCFINSDTLMVVGGFDKQFQSLETITYLIDLKRQVIATKARLPLPIKYGQLHVYGDNVILAGAVIESQDEDSETYVAAPVMMYNIRQDIW